MAVSIRARDPPANIRLGYIGTRGQAVHTAAPFGFSTRICTDPGDAVRCDVSGKFPSASPKFPNSLTRDSFSDP